EEQQHRAHSHSSRIGHRKKHNVHDERGSSSPQHRCRYFSCDFHQNSEIQKREDLPNVPELCTKRATGRKHGLPVFFQQVSSNRIPTALGEQCAQQGFGPNGWPSLFLLVILSHAPPFSGQRTPAQIRSTAALASFSARMPGGSIE